MSSLALAQRVDGREGRPLAPLRLRWAGLLAAASSGLVLFSAPPANAAVVFQETVPFSGGSFNSCSAPPEFVTVEGNNLLVATVTVDSSGGTHVAGHSVFQGVSGVGSVTGQRYAFPNVTNTIDQQLSSGGTEFTEVTSFHLVSQGPTDNTRLIVVEHFTIAPSGLSSSTSNVRFECDGPTP